MKRIIFSLYTDDLAEHASASNEKRLAFKKYASQLDDVKQRYAKSVGADYKLFKPDSTSYDNIQFQKLIKFEELAQDYDEILYLDYDVVPIRNESFFEHHDLNTICAYNINCYLDTDIIRARNRDRYVWNGMDMYSKAQNKRAMLILHDTSGSNYCINTGVLGMNKDMVKRLDFKARLKESRQTFDDALIDNLYPPMMTRQWVFNNEVVLSYLIERYNLPFTNIGAQWNFIADDTQPKISSASYFLHFVNKQFELYFTQDE